MTAFAWRRSKQDRGTLLQTVSPGAGKKVAKTRANEREIVLFSDDRCVMGLL